ncbi:MAG: BPSS1780 family membrane protein [Usitatibacter sp.]
MSAPAPATAAVAADDDLKLVLPGRTRPAGDGVKWIGDGWKLFAKTPLMWILALLVLIVIWVVLGFVPIVGWLALQVLTPVFYAGLIVACRSIERGNDFELEHLFAGFKVQFANLAITGVIFLVGWLLLLLVFMFFAGFGIVAAIVTGSTQDIMPAIAGSAMAILLGLLVMLALMVPLLAAYWFAPALVVMHGLAPFDAMKASFFACFRNFVSFLLYGVVMMVLAVVAMIPFGLGMLVWIPLTFTSTYAAYRDIFTEATAPASGTVTV